MSITVYGASDDLIEVEGDLSDEFSYHDERDNYLAFSDGTLLEITYGGDDGGFWRIHKLSQGSSICTLTQATDDESDYSDKMVLESAVPIRWVVHGISVTQKLNR